MATSTDHESHKMFNGVEKRRRESKNVPAKLIIEKKWNTSTDKLQKPD